ncbi:uncharacterized protein PITG_04119 [Phytophthora infestans T30-4]|uniref:Uncharacterized protein n=1 Tax=Phytophthora infestans (strain T30-4) TaxID=403677 RepID=D0N0L4_PHYIT|nr:uncharacterized protein PITG_04119 [Phytophthora infestans T30-4]EEY67177.1 conserved hypothetical protein [Phytophthora infestans T30-4]|eukprot:XP_002905825.1 conserved hypothetical protein [Phytophthora infestans T30-4]
MGNETWRISGITLGMYADLYQATRSTTRRQRERLLLRPLDQDDFVWPTLDTIAAAQLKVGSEDVLNGLEEAVSAFRKIGSVIKDLISRTK